MDVGSSPWQLEILPAFQRWEDCVTERRETESEGSILTRAGIPWMQCLNKERNSLRVANLVLSSADWRHGEGEVWGWNNTVGLPIKCGMQGGLWHSVSMTKA